MDYLKKILVREMSKCKEDLLNETDKGIIDIELAFPEDPGEITYLIFVRDDDLENAVKGAVKEILGENVQVVNIEQMDRTIFFSVLCP